MSEAPTSLYQLYGLEGNYLKTGITSNPAGRYMQDFMSDKFMDIFNVGSRSEMMDLERLIVEYDAGPLNFEPWACAGPMSTYPALAIEAVAGGPGTSRAWSDAVKALGKRVMEIRANVESPLAVNVVYQIPGQFLEPDFLGVRTGKFSRKEARLLVQVALPPEPTSDAASEVRELLSEAVLEAEKFAQQEGMIDGPLTEVRELAARA